MNSARPVVLFVVNHPNWAHDLKTDALTRCLGEKYLIVKRFHRDVSCGDIERADCLVFYFWLQLEALPALREAVDKKPDRVAIGICSHLELQGEQRSRGLAVLNAAGAVFVNSQLLLQEFQPLLARPAHYTPNGVDTDFFRPSQTAWKARRLRVGWAGSLLNHTPEHRGVHEVIAPAVDAADGAELHLAVREQRWRSRDEMRAFYHSIDVYMCASISEGTPNPCLEAAASGVPIVTTRVGNMPEFVRDGANGLFIERTADDAAAKLRRLLDEPELRQRLGCAARVTAEGWDWRNLAGRYDEMIRTIVH